MIGQQQYLETEVLTATPYRLHLLALDGAIRFARQAEQALSRRDFEASHLALSQSRDLVGELLGGLDDEKSPELVDNLKTLFVFAYRNLAHADMMQDATAIHRALRVLTLHRETWTALQSHLLQDVAPQDHFLPRPHLGTDDLPTSGRSWTT